MQVASSHVRLQRRKLRITFTFPRGEFCGGSRIPYSLVLVVKSKCPDVVVLARVDLAVRPLLVAVVEVGYYRSLHCTVYLKSQQSNVKVDTSRSAYEPSHHRTNLGSSQVVGSGVNQPPPSPGIQLLHLNLVLLLPLLLMPNTPLRQLQFRAA